MNNVIDFCGIIVLLRKLKETGTFTEEELERVAARIAADTHVKIDLILTKSISSFSRNTVDCLHYTRLLKSWGIAVFFEKENINSLQSERKLLINRIAGSMEIELLPERGSEMSLGDINARLAELEYDFQKMLTRAADDGDYEAYTEKFRTIAEEIAGLKERRSVIETHRTGSKTDLRIRHAVDFFENNSSDLTEWNDSLMRQLIDWVKILSAEEILVCLHGGIEVRQRMG